MFFSHPGQLSNQNKISPTCLLYSNGIADLQHFILTFVALEAARTPILNDTETENSLRRMYRLSVRNYSGLYPYSYKTGEVTEY